jgi:hypothetical protein
MTHYYDKICRSSSLVCMYSLLASHFHPHLTIMIQFWASHSSNVSIYVLHHSLYHLTLLLHHYFITLHFIMQDLFESTSRYRELFNEELPSHLAPLTPRQCPEIRLLPDTEPRDILSAAAAAALDNDGSTNDTCRTVTNAFQQFHAFCGDQIVWMAPDIFVIAVQHNVDVDATDADVATDNADSGVHQNNNKRTSWHSILHPNVFSIQDCSTGQGFSVVALNNSSSTGPHNNANAQDARRQQEAVATCDLIVHLLAQSSSSARATASSRSCNTHVRLQSYLPHTVTAHPYQVVPQPPPVSAAALEYLLQQQQQSQSQDCHTSPTLDLINFYLPRAHWNALATIGGNGDNIDIDNNCHYQIRLVQCRTVTETDCHAAVQCLQSDRGPTRLIACDIPVSTLAAGLRGNARVQSWTQAEPTTGPASSSSLSLAQDTEQLLHAVSQNQGLASIQFARSSLILSTSVSASVSNNKSKNYYWNLLWDSVQHHPKLTNISFGDCDRSDNGDPHPPQGTALNLNLTTTAQQPVAVADATGDGIGMVDNAAAETTAATPATTRTTSVTTNSTLSARQKTARTRMLATKLQSNTVLQSIQFADVSHSVSGDDSNHHPYVDLQVWKAAVHPILERNVVRPRIAALQVVTADRSPRWRQKLLLSAVCANRGNANILYMILSSAADVVAATGTKSCHNHSNMTDMMRNNKRKAQGNAHMDLGQASLLP